MQLKKRMFIAGTAAFCLMASLAQAQTDSHAVAGGEDFKQNANVLTVAARPAPSGELLAHIMPGLQQQGVDLRIVPITDSTEPHQLVSTGDVDVACYGDQHMLALFNNQRYSHLVSLGELYIAPMKLYSSKVKDLKDVREHGIVVIPSETVGAARALQLLQAQGLIQLKPKAGLRASVKDIVSNPKQLIFREVQSSNIALELDKSDLIAVSNNFASQVFENLTDNSLAQEADSTPFATICVTTAGKKDNEQVQKLMHALHSQDALNFVHEKYKDVLTPVATGK